MQQVFQFNWNQQESFRGEMWEKIIQDWTMSPLLGVGFGRKFDFQMRTPYGEWHWVAPQNFHNTYLELLLKSGILGITIFSYAYILSYSHDVGKSFDSVPKKSHLWQR